MKHKHKYRQQNRTTHFYLCIHRATQFFIFSMVLDGQNFADLGPSGFDAELFGSLFQP